MLKKLGLLSFVLTICCAQVFAQTVIKVRGTITEAGTGIEIPGVAISEKGSTLNRILSDDLGTYQISVPSDAVLLFQALGYQDVEVPVEGQDVIDVIMELDAIMLESAVSIGYGSAKKVGNIVGNVTTVKSDVVKNAPSASALDLLQGQVAGMQVLSTGGVAGDNNISMKIHGVGSLTSSSEPLFIVDGIQSSSSAVMAMNPNDILNVTVLTDASATSIYGAQGANGVVYVTTKSGAFNQDATITINSQYGISTLANEQFFKNMMNSSELKNFWIRSGLMTENAIYKNYISKGYNADTQWYKYIQRLNNPQYQNDVTIEGGSDRTAYMIAASQFHQDGNTIGNYYDRYTVRSNVQARPKEWAKIGATANLTYTQDMANEAWGDSSSSSNYIDGGLSYLHNPLYPAVDENGKEFEIIYPTGVYNQYYYTKNYVNKYDTYRLNGSLFLQLEPIKNLILTSRVGTDSYVRFMDRYKLASAAFSKSVGGMVQKSSYMGFKHTVNNTIEYSLPFNEGKDDLNILFGQEYIDYTYKSYAAFGYGISDDRFMSLSNIDKESAQVDQSKTQYRFFSLFAHAEYNSMDKYFADFTVRNDASSRFGKNHRNGTFWATGLMWKASNEEDFSYYLPWINKMNVKASYGTQGNANIGNYAHLGLISQLSTPYNGKYGIVLSSPANDDITWENQHLLTVGVDAKLFNKVDLNVAYYNRRTTDMLMSVPNPYTSGFPTMYANVGSMMNQGIDLNISYDIINTRNVYLSARATFAYNAEKVTELFNGLEEWVVPNTGVGYIVGQPVMYYDVIYAGVDPTDGAPMWYLPKVTTDPITGEEISHPNECTKDPNRVTKE